MPEAVRPSPESPTPTVVITGGHGGLGTVLADAFAHDGWKVFAPGHAELDVTDAELVNHWFRSLERCDVLINNAGVTRDRLLARITEDDWDRVLSTNLGGAMHCSRAALPLMLRQKGGAILNIGSHSGFTGPIGQANYAAAKAALVGFTRSLAAEYGAKNIRANVVLPGFMETPMTSGLAPEVIERARQAHHLRRFTTPEETARFVAFLATCQNISGQIFALDSRPVDW